MDQITPDHRSPAGDRRPSDRAGPRRVGLVSVHTSPLEQPGTGDSGGMNVYLTSLARRLADQGIDTHLFTRSSGDDLPPSVALAPGVTVHHIKAGPARASKAQLATHLCAFYLGLAAHPVVTGRATGTGLGLDLLHGHYWMSGWVGRQAKRRLGIPLVQTFHTLAEAKNAALAPGDSPEPVLRLAAEHRIAAAADAIVAPTPEEAALLRRAYQAPAGAVHVVEPGVDLTVFSPDGDRHAARQSLGGGRIVLFVGRLQPLKGPDVAVRTLAALTELLPDDSIPVRLVVVGGASGNGHGTTDQRALRDLAGQLGVADRVAFLAPRPQTELAALYRAADVVVVPSHNESFGLVALEAQACGTPVVAADVGGLRHVVGGGGTLVPGHDPADHARALVPYLTDAAHRTAAGRAGRRRAEGFGWDRTAAAVAGIYAGVLRAAAPPLGAGRRGA